MVNNPRRSRRKMPSRRNPLRQQVRQISRALTFEPRRVTAPPDPPSLPNIFSHTTVLPVDVILSTSGAGFVTSSILGQNSRFKCKIDTVTKTVGNDGASAADLFGAWCRYVGMQAITGVSYDVAIRRVVYWGPQNTDQCGVEIALGVDQGGDLSAPIIVKDVGNTNNRARCAITVPHTVWQGSGTTKVVTRVYPDPSNMVFSNFTELADGTIWGVVHITLSVRSLLVSVA